MVMEKIQLKNFLKNQIGIASKILKKKNTAGGLALADSKPIIEPWKRKSNSTDFEIKPWFCHLGWVAFGKIFKLLRL